MILRQHADAIRLLFDNGSEVDLWFHNSGNLVHGEQISVTVISNEAEIVFSSADSLVSFLAEKANE